MKLAEILEIRFESCDLGKTVTINEYLRELLLTLWEEGEGFSGKRPFGNSGWEHALYAPLIKSGVIAGELDGDGYIKEVNSELAHSKVRELIKLCFNKNTVI